MSMLDVVMPRTAQGQSKVGTEVPKDVAALKPGDVLTFGRGKRISHVGIYVGDGNMVHASTSQRQVIETSLTKRSPLIRQWKGVRRFVDANTTQLRDSILAFADSISK
jgi:cell wall-associated NlpC family hydrolase